MRVTYRVLCGADASAFLTADKGGKKLYVWHKSSM